MKEKKNKTTESPTVSSRGQTTESEHSVPPPGGIPLVPMGCTVFGRDTLSVRGSVTQNGPNINGPK